MKKTILFLSCFIFHFYLMAQHQFTGRFNGQQNGISSTAELRVENGLLKGTVSLNGKTARLSGTQKDTATSGNLHDNETGTTYAYTGYLLGKELHLSITFPELNNTVVELVMQKETGAAAVTAKPVAGKRDARLIGTWRYTEVISSGSGGNFGSFSADYFMEFKTDGTVYSWSGSATASGGGNSFESNGNSKKEKGEWSTEGNKLILTDPVTRQSAAVFFAADASRIMLHNGGAGKKVWERVQ